MINKVNAVLQISHNGVRALFSTIKGVRNGWTGDRIQKGGRENA